MIRPGGGQGMPRTVSMAADNYFNGANFPFMLHNILVHGAGKLVERFGTDQQKRLYLKTCTPGNGAAPCCSPNRKPAPMWGR